MDFIIIPSNRASFGLPQVKGRSWLGALVLVQLAYFVSYQVIGIQRLRISDDPFMCSQGCIPAHFVLMVDWFVSSISILLPMITDELLFDDFVYFSYHYIYFVRLFLFYRVTLLVILLPASGIPAWLLGFLTVFHFSIIIMLVRIFYVLLKEIEKSKQSLIAIHITFRKLICVSFVKVLRSIEGNLKSLAPNLSNRTSSAMFSDVCPICYEVLNISVQRNVTSVSKTRVNMSIGRPHSHGKVDVFTTSCHHSFHRDCLMKVCRRIINCLYIHVVDKWKADKGRTWNWGVAGRSSSRQCFT